MKLLYGLVVDCDGHLCVRVECELDVVAGPVLPRSLVARQLQVLAASTQGGQGAGQNSWQRREIKGSVSVLRYDTRVSRNPQFGWNSRDVTRRRVLSEGGPHRTSRSVSLRMFMRLRSVFTGS